MNRRYWPTAVLTVLLLSRGTIVQAQKVLPEGVKDLAAQIAANVAKDQKRKIAVLPFRELDGRSTVLGTYIAEELVTDLFNLGNIDIVERAMLDKILAELQLGQMGLIDPETAKKVGKLAGVDAVVTGTITDLQSYVALNCRLIDTQTGRIFGAAQARIVKDDDVKKIMGAAMAASDAPAVQNTSVKAEPDHAQKQQTSLLQEEADFVFELKSCFGSGTSVRCKFLVTNNGKDRPLSIYAGSMYGKSRAIDDDGNEYSTNHNDLYFVLASRVPMTGQVVFEKVSSRVRLLKLLELNCFSSIDYKSFKIQFRDIYISLR